MWTYHQSSGQLFHDEELIGAGYSGFGLGKNNPEKEELSNYGPIPQGWYTIGPPHDTQAHGPHVLPLTPAKETEMYGRSEFLIHGDSLKTPGTASKGCIILNRAIRDKISESGDNQLTVVP